MMLDQDWQRLPSYGVGVHDVGYKDWQSLPSYGVNVHDVGSLLAESSILRG